MFRWKCVILETYAKVLTPSDSTCHHFENRISKRSSRENEVLRIRVLPNPLGLVSVEGEIRAEMGTEGRQGEGTNGVTAVMR